MPARMVVALSHENLKCKPGFSCSHFPALASFPVCKVALVILGLEWKAARVC